MADKTKIEWSEATWNPITGCSRISPGCGGPGDNGGCYAELLAGTRLRNHPSREGLTKATPKGPRWTGEVRLNEDWLGQPIRWTKPRMIFVCAHGDLFHESVPDEWIDRVFAVMALCPQHTFQVLTKRASRMRDYCQNMVAGKTAIVSAADRMGRAEDAMRALTGDDGSAEVKPLPNLWLGVSAENQTYADQRLPQLEQTPAAVRWISFEPLLGEIDYDLSPFDWAVVGGESGPRARNMHPNWARMLRDFCAEDGVPFFFKQWGEWLPWEFADAPFLRSQAGHYEDAHQLPDADDDPNWCQDWANDEFEAHCLFQKTGKKAAGRLLDGKLHDAFPRQLEPAE